MSLRQSKSDSNIMYNTHVQLSAGSVKIESTIRLDSFSNILKNAVLVTNPQVGHQLHRSMTSSSK
jgi:hypothetical protein